MHSFKVLVMASVVDEFLHSPSDHLLSQCTKDQLLKIAEHYDIDISDKRLRDNIKAILRANLLDAGVFQKDEGIQPSSVNAGLSFEQQKELLKLKLEHDKL